MWIVEEWNIDTNELVKEKYSREGANKMKNNLKKSYLEVLLMPIAYFPHKISQKKEYFPMPPSNF